ncbi:MAG: NYN domain-containing protein, partial [Acidimicrobiales bacterium]
MAINHVIVDGSNIATEGRTAPSLAQLDEAVRAFLDEYGDVALTVVVDATFGHRIAGSEQAEFEAGIVNGELVTPPAGAIGRGDAFILQIAAKTNATVFSNDSFQEFHGSYEWLFDEGRLIGGKPVPAVGWVFVPRTPVRGPTSRRSTREARSGGSSGSGGSGRKRSRGPAASASANEPMPVPTAPPPRAQTDTAGMSAADETIAEAGDDRPAKSVAKRKAAPRKASSKKASVQTDVDHGSAAPTPPSPIDDGGSRNRRRRSSSQKPSKPINDAMPYLAFVSDHPVGSTVEAVVDRFSSHGAYAVVG